MFTIEQCVMCGCKDVPNKTLEIPVNVHGIVSVSVKGAKCSQCGEEYYDMKDTKAIEEMEKSMREQAVGA